MNKAQSAIFLATWGRGRLSMVWTVRAREAGHHHEDVQRPPPPDAEHRAGLEPCIVALGWPSNHFRAQNPANRDTQKLPQGADGSTTPCPRVGRGRPSDAGTAWPGVGLGGGQGHRVHDVVIHPRQPHLPGGGQARRAGERHRPPRRPANEEAGGGQRGRGLRRGVGAPACTLRRSTAGLVMLRTQRPIHRP